MTEREKQNEELKKEVAINVSYGPFAIRLFKYIDDTEAKAALPGLSPTCLPCLRSH
jgi:hypothetical protein